MKLLWGVSLVVLVCWTNFAFAQAFGPTNILTRVGSDIREYGPAGTVLRTIPVPYPPGARPGTEPIRDLSVMNDGRLAVYNGTFNPYLSLYDPQTAAWEHFTLPGWSTGNNRRFAGLAAHGPYIFASDGSTANAGSPSGTIRFDVRDGSAIRFETQFDVGDVTIGGDGLLYTLGFGGNGAQVNVYNPWTLGLLRTISFDSIASVINSIAVDRDGSIFIGALDDQIRVYDTAGLLKRTYGTTPAAPQDLDIASDGRMTFTFGGGTRITTTALLSHSTLGSGEYACFVNEVPEPSGPIFVGTLLLLFRQRR